MPNCSPLIADAISRLGATALAAARARNNELMVRDLLFSKAFQAPSCETAAEALRVTVPLATDPGVGAARQVVELLLVAPPVAPRPPIAGILLGTGLIAVASALLVIPTRMHG